MMHHHLPTTAFAVFPFYYSCGAFCGDALYHTFVLGRYLGVSSALCGLFLFQDAKAKDTLWYDRMILHSLQSRRVWCRRTSNERLNVSMCQVRELNNLYVSNHHEFQEKVQSGFIIQTSVKDRE